MFMLLTPLKKKAAKPEAGGGTKAEELRAEEPQVEEPVEA
jgi:hypothetical protein